MLPLAPAFAFLDVAPPAPALGLAPGCDECGRPLYCGFGADVMACLALRRFSAASRAFAAGAAGGGGGADWVEDIAGKLDSGG